MAGLKKQPRDTSPAALELVVDNKQPPETPKADQRDSYEVQHPFADSAIHAAIAQLSWGISPISLIEAYQDWLLHLAVSPGRQLELMQEAAENQARLADLIGRCFWHLDPEDECIDRLPDDKRFRHEAWREWPFNIFQQSFLLTQQWWHSATTKIPGISEKNKRMVEFYSRQFLDMCSPANFPLTNPVVIERALASGGQNFWHGYLNFLDDMNRHLENEKPAGTEEFTVGENLAVTPGKVVYRNKLIELIQYAPATNTVYREPILITPAWIMKYYILDLSPENSLVRYLVSKGHTVFVISWVNPAPELRDTSFDDYRCLGLREAVNAVCCITGHNRLHAVGYCLGGTLLAIEAALMAREKDNRFASVSFFAAQVDFADAGELTLFINESQVSFLEDLMKQKGYLSSNRMAGAFQLLRSQDLIWSRMVQHYLLGEKSKANDLIAWNADATRMPYRMHSEYLRRIFLNNDLANGRFLVKDRPVYVEDIKAPVFIVATETDHVSPWKSVFKLMHLLDTDVTFVLTNGGHNAGIISEPGHAGRHYRMAGYPVGSKHPHAKTWMDKNSAKPGSWWPEWAGWLEKISTGKTDPPPMGAPAKGYPAVDDAPGRYVHQA